MIVYEKNEPPLTNGGCFIDPLLLPTHKVIYESPYLGAVEKFLSRYGHELRALPASVYQHHWWAGGLRHHVGQVIYLCMEYAAIAHRLKTLTKKDLSKLAVIAFLHDAEKIFRYEEVEGDRSKFNNIHRDGQIYKIKNYFGYKPERASSYLKTLQEDLISIKMAAECGFPMEDWLINGICFAAGGYSAYAKEMQPLDLSIILHQADMMSAHAFFNVGHITS